MIHRVPLGAPAEFKSDLVVYVDTQFQGEQPFALYSREDSVLAIGGTKSVEVLQAALTSAAADIISRRAGGDALVLSGDSFVHSNGAISLVLGNLRNPLLAAENQFSSAHATVWDGADGLSRLFAGQRVPISSENKSRELKRGELAETSGSDRFVTSTVASTTNTKSSVIPQKQPTNVVFLTSDAKLPAVVELDTPVRAQRYLLSGLQRQQPFFDSVLPRSDVAGADVARFGKFLQANNVRTFVANLNNAKKPFSVSEFDTFFSNPKKVTKLPSKEFDEVDQSISAFLSKNFASIQL